MRETPHQEQVGFVSFAVSNEDVDYLRLCYLQALNIKCTQSNSRYAIIVDPKNKEKINDSHRDVFDYIIDIPDSCDNVGNTGNKRFDHEWRVFGLTPFKETIKVESDLLFTRSILHWYEAFRLKDVFLSFGCRDFQQKISSVRAYRKLFDKNQLPDVYNGLMYFRYSKHSQKFFNIARYIFENWDQVKTALKNCNDQVPTTDVVYSLADKIMGDGFGHVPRLDFVNFVHMKSGIQGWSDEQEWTDHVMHEWDGDMLRINNINQINPVHYYNKQFATDELIEYYEHRFARINKSF